MDSSTFKPLAEADALDGEIAARQSQFLAERDALAIAQAQACAQKIREANAHFARANPILRGERGDGVQAVKEEVRVQLKFQRLQLRFARERPRFFGAPFGLALFHGGNRRVVQTGREQIKQRAQGE